MLAPYKYRTVLYCPVPVPRTGTTDGSLTRSFFPRTTILVPSFGCSNHCSFIIFVIVEVTNELFTSVQFTNRSIDRSIDPTNQPTNLRQSNSNAWQWQQDYGMTRLDPRSTTNGLYISFLASSWQWYWFWHKTPRRQIPLLKVVVLPPVPTTLTKKRNGIRNIPSILRIVRHRHKWRDDPFHPCRNKFNDKREKQNYYMLRPF